LLLTPTALPSLTGNAVTIERWRRALAARGIEARVFAAKGLDGPRFALALREVAPDLIHVYHAWKSGRLLFDPAAAALAGSLPWVVSLAGTDIERDALIAEKRALIEAVCRRARAVATQSEATRDRFVALFPALARWVRLFPKAVAFAGSAPCDLRGASGASPGDVLFFHPGGVRPIKGNLESLEGLAIAHSREPRLRAVFSGPILDAEYGARFDAALGRGCAFARRLAPIPPEAMRAAYLASDVVLNTSFAEGLSNVLLEAMAIGRPVLATDIPPNRAVVADERGGPPAGLLYPPGDAEKLARAALRLARKRTLREALAAAARARAARLPTPEGEAEALEGIYREALL
jgi:glycosyltransferase involved in cell wall biosynthesis